MTFLSEISLLHKNQLRTTEEGTASYVWHAEYQFSHKKSVHYGLWHFIICDLMTTFTNGNVEVNSQWINLNRQQTYEQILSKYF